MQAALILVLALAAGDGATESLRTRDAEIRAALPPEGEQPTPAVKRRLEAIITRTIDLKAMVEAAMDRHWKAATEAQRKRIVAAFENRFRKASTNELDGYRSTSVEYRKEVELPGGVIQVPTRVVVKGEPTDVTYTLRRGRDGWRIIDIVIDGVSTVANYRSSFARIIAKEGVEGLIRRLEKGGTTAKNSPP